MRIVQALPGLTKFIIFKGEHGAVESLDIDTVVGVPFDVPDEVGKARIKASPNLYHEATEEDEKFAQEYKKKELERLNALIQTKKDEVLNTQKEIASLQAKTEGKDDGFNTSDFILNNQPLTVENLTPLERPQLLEVAAALEITDFPKNIPNVKLIQLILENV